MRRLTVCGLLVMAVGGAGCGSGTEPLATFSPSSQTPQLSLPVTDTLVSSVSPFVQSGSGTPSDGFNLNLTLAGQSVVAPAAGIISYVDLTGGAAIVYIIHSTHLMTRISSLQAVSVQVGQIVQPGSGIGLSSATNAFPVHFTVYFDNAVVCPLSFLSFAEQKALRIVSPTPVCQ